MKKLVDPVMAAYAKEIGADKIYEQINVIHDPLGPWSRAEGAAAGRPRRGSRETCSQETCANSSTPTTGS